MLAEVKYRECGKETTGSGGFLAKLFNSISVLTQVLYHQ